MLLRRCSTPWSPPIPSLSATVVAFIGRVKRLNVSVPKKAAHPVLPARPVLHSSRPPQSSLDEQMKLHAGIALSHAIPHNSRSIGNPYVCLQHLHHGVQVELHDRVITGIGREKGRGAQSPHLCSSHISCTHTGRRYLAHTPHPVMVRTPVHLAVHPLPIHHRPSLSIPLQLSFLHLVHHSNMVEHLFRLFHQSLS